MTKERFDQIEKDNKILLRKMTEIMQKEQFNTLNEVEYKSLNREYRKRELMRITAENQSILKRIQHRQPFYNHLNWEEERKINEKYCKNICQYDYVLGAPGSEGFVSAAMDEEEMGEEDQQQQQDDYENEDDAAMQQQGEETAHDNYYDEDPSTNNDAGDGQASARQGEETTGYSYDDADQYGPHGIESQQQQQQKQQEDEASAQQQPEEEQQQNESFTQQQQQESENSSSEAVAASDN